MSSAAYRLGDRIAKAIIRAPHPRPSCQAHAALMRALRRLCEAEREVAKAGGFHGRVLPSQREASAELDRAASELDRVIAALS